MLQVLLAVIWLLLIPTGCGLYITKRMPKECHHFGYVILNGYLIMIALFHCFYLGFVLAGSISFRYLSLCFGIFIVICSLVSAWFGRGIIKDCLIKIKEKDALFLKVIFVLIIVVQLVMRLAQQVSDGDDAFFVATATATEVSNTMNLIQPYTGFFTDNLDVRHAFSSAPIWIAFLSEMTQIHPAIMSHSVFSLVLIILHYLVIAGIGAVLFDEKKKAYLFNVLAGIFNIYGFVSIYTAQTFFLTRTWQGKSIFANLFLPVLFLILLQMAKKSKKEKIENIYYIWAGVIMLGATSMTTMAVFAMPLVFMAGIVFLAIYRKNPGMIGKALPACIPVGIVGLLFLLA